MGEAFKEVFLLLPKLLPPSWRFLFGTIMLGRAVAGAIHH
jgi:hypothetical protein